MTMKLFRCEWCDGLDTRDNLVGAGVGEDFDGLVHPGCKIYIIRDGLDELDTEPMG